MSLVAERIDAGSLDTSQVDEMISENSLEAYLSAALPFDWDCPLREADAVAELVVLPSVDRPRAAGARTSAGMLARAASVFSIGEEPSGLSLGDEPTDAAVDPPSPLPRPDSSASLAGSDVPKLSPPPSPPQPGGDADGRGGGGPSDAADASVRPQPCWQIRLSASSMHYVSSASLRMQAVNGAGAPSEPQRPWFLGFAVPLTLVRRVFPPQYLGACRRRTPRTRVDLKVPKRRVSRRPFRRHPPTRSSPRRPPSACAEKLPKIGSSCR